MKPRPKTPKSMSFCFLGSSIVQTTGIGIRNIRKSVTGVAGLVLVLWHGGYKGADSSPMCRLVCDHQRACGWQYFFSMVKSQ